jgi:Mg-chelatase subunit ChlD
VTRSTFQEAALEKAELAYREFNKMAPMLSNYASGVIGKRVVVKAGKNTETDGKTIWIRPHLSLATKLDHQRSKCGTRDAEDHLICDACASREELLTGLHHEIAHIAHGSFDVYEKTFYTKAVRKISKHLPEHHDRAKQVSSLFRNPTDTLHYANKIHPHLAFLNQALEDHRINSASFIDRPGLKVASRAFSKKILTEGIPLPDGTFDKWGDRRLDEQMMIGPLFYMEGHDIRGYLDDSVVDAVLTDESKAILDEIETLTDSWAALESSIELLGLYRKAGFFQLGKDQDNMTPEQEAEWEEFLKALGGIFIQLFGHDQTSCSGAGVRYEQAGGGDPNVQQLDRFADRDLDKVIEIAGHLDSVPYEMSGIAVHQPYQGPAYGYGRRRLLAKPPEAIMGKAVSKGRLALNKNARAQRHRNQKEGRVDSGSLGKRAWNPDDGRLFKTTTHPDKRDYEVLIGIDISGSTSSRGRAQLIRDSTIAMAEFCRRLGIKFSIYAHTTQGARMDIYIIKDVKEVWDDKIKERLARLGSGASNMDGHTLQFYRKKLDQSKATDKILMYITDGVMPGTNWTEEVPVLKSEIRECAKRRYTLLGIGVFTDAPREHGLPNVRVDSEADYIRVVDYLAKHIVNR